MVLGAPDASCCRLSTTLASTANDFGPEGTEALVGVLPHCAFPELDLTRCKIGDGGAQILAATLHMCPHITSLVLEGAPPSDRRVVVAMPPR